ncbi:hypothetical protein BD310DRAFT_926827 [Dichomitus squalens]|uniref:Uncharacterized protein n=1 Tax=Dichomitus squalens TaxID=114155 RepID=A0A4Q9PVM2_9APHY|nr:hypothetical protein BD310DRAFT_926827 [Dichomitus squalens]
MRLLDIDTGLFVWVGDPRTASYAILSHVWDREGEQTYQDLLRLQQSFLPVIGTRPILLWIWAALWWRILLAISFLLSVGRDVVHRRQLIDSLPFRHIAREETLEYLARWLAGWVAVTHGAAVDIRSRRTYLHGNIISEKVRRACQVAREQGYRYIWIDSCCIDKMNIPECSRAISSMYSWYREAAVCYAFLADVGVKDSFVFEFADFRKSKWFTRGWTLQELIAPQVVLFLSADWRALGSKSTLAAVIEDVTGVERTILRKQKALATVSVARRMSWAAKRQTTVLEDRAYSLLGIFDINIPTLYGEGGRAFIRLQQEILKQHPDQSLLVWGKINLEPLLPLVEDSPSSQGRVQRCWREPEPYVASSLLAHSPDVFGWSKGFIQDIPYDVFLHRIGLPDFTLPVYYESPYGIRVDVPLFKLSDVLPSESLDQQSQIGDWYIILLACEHRGHLLGRVCYARPSQIDVAVLASGQLAITTSSQPELSSPKYGIIALSPEFLERCRSKLQVKTVYMPLPHVYTNLAFVVPPPAPPPGQQILALASWVYPALASQGYSILAGTTVEEHHAGTLLLVRGPADSIGIAYKYTPERQTVQVSATMLGTYIDVARGVSRPGPSDWLTWMLYARRIEFQELRFRTREGKDVVVRMNLERMYDHTPPLRLGIDVIEQDTGVRYMRAEVSPNATDSEASQGGTTPVGSSS